MEPGTAIKLKYHHSHIEDSVLVFNCGKCIVYLTAEKEAHGTSIIRLAFEGVKCVRSARTDCSPALGIYPEEPFNSFIVEFSESKWAVEARKSYAYLGSSMKPSGRHFVVTNHDIFHEILADSFVESIILPNETEYEIAKFHIS